MRNRSHQLTRALATGMSVAAATLTVGAKRLLRRDRAEPLSPMRDARRVVLIRGAALGLVPYWPSADTLARLLQRRGFNSQVINHHEFRTIADELSQQVQQGYWQGGLYLAGYSFGADFACLLAERLSSAGISVSAMVLMESTFGIPVPQNVKCCINYYKTRLLDFIPSSRGIQVSAESPHTELTNVNVRNYASLSELATRSHFTIGDHPLQHELAAEFLITRRPPAFLNVAKDGADRQAA